MKENKKRIPKNSYVPYKTVEDGDLSRIPLPSIIFYEDESGAELEKFYQECLDDSGYYCNAVGVRVGDGNGTCRSYEKSAICYAHACAMDFGKSCRNLAKRYKTGKGVVTDLMAA